MPVTMSNANAAAQTMQTEAGIADKVYDFIANTVSKTNSYGIQTILSNAGIGYLTVGISVSLIDGHFKQATLKFGMAATLLCFQNLLNQDVNPNLQNFAVLAGAVTRAAFRSIAGF